jgi:hypothetical protein
MKTKVISPREQWGLKLSCPSCGVDANEPCRTWSGGSAKMHVSRCRIGRSFMNRFDTDAAPQKTPMCQCPVCIDIVIGMCLERNRGK